MSEEESEKIEVKSIQSDPSEILQNIDDNLTQIRTELEKFNKDKLRENIRLAVLIVTYTIPFSFFVGILTSFYASSVFPFVNLSDSRGIAYASTIALPSILFVFLTYKIVPLFKVLKDPQVLGLLEELDNKE